MCGWSQGGTCSRVVPVGVRYCEEHEKQRGWERGKNRTRTNAPGHEKRRERVLARDGHRCQICYAGICTEVASVCDHILAIGLGGADSDDNCQAACPPCSRRKASREGHLAAGHRDIDSRP